jgi:Xaa-Pro aminopeptidase
MPETHDVRRNRLRTLVREADADAALVTRLVNVRYLTGFTGSNAALLVTEDTAVLATDGRYITQSAAEVPDLERLIDRLCPEALVSRAGDSGVRRLAVEAHDVTVERHATLAGLAGDMELQPLGWAVESLRTVKDEDEIALLAEACAIGDRALAELVTTVRPGRTERDIARELMTRMLDHGADALSFPTIVGSGPNSAIPHNQPSDRRVAKGELLKIDFGAEYGGYHSDCTRTFVVGAEPATWQIELHQLVREAQRAGRHALAPGADAAKVDAAAREVIEEAGYGEQFPHGLGHGVGLEIHEAPLMGYTADARLADRMPVTVEPGVYLPGRGGVRIEDTLVVREGGPELLTTASKELLVL